MSLKNFIKQTSAITHIKGNQMRFNVCLKCMCIYYKLFLSHSKLKIKTHLFIFILKITHIDNIKFIKFIMKTKGQLLSIPSDF